VASKGKSTIDVEVDTSSLSALVALAEKYRDVLKESNDILKANVDITKQASGAQERLNRTAGEGRRSSREHRKREQAEEDIFPEGKRYRASGKFTSRPTWSQAAESGPSGRFSAGWEKPSGNLSDMDRLRWGPGRSSSGSGQFTGGWAKPSKGPLSDMDRLPWGPGKDNTGSGQFKATFEKFAKGNDKWNEQFYQMFSTGRLGQNVLRNMFSGNLIKMLGIGGVAAGLGYAVAEGASVGAQQRRQALGIGGDIGKMKSAQVELARFGPVDPGLEAARRAKTGIGPEFSAYMQMGFTANQIKTMDPSDMYAQMLLKAQQFAKANINNPAMANIAEAKGIPGVLGGGMTTLNTLQGTSTEEAQNAAAAIAANAKYLESSQEQLKALTGLTATLNLASSEIQTHFINKLADIAPAIDNFIKNQMNKINTGPEAAPGLKPGGIFNSDNWGWGGPILGGKPSTLPTGPQPNGKLRKVPNLHSPLNNPPLESSIQGSAAVGESDGEVSGGLTRVSIFSPKIAKLNKDVTDTSRSLAEFNEQLLKGSQIMVSGAYLAGRQATKDAAAGGNGINIGGGGGFGTTGGAGIYHSGGMGAAGEPTEVSRSGGVVSGVTQVAKGALAKNQQEMYNAAIAEGLSPTAARALVANSSGESLKNPADVHRDPSRRNPNQMAHGIASWDDERSARIMKQFGKMPQDMSVAEQTKAMIWEQKNFYPKTWQALSGGGSAESMTGTLVSDFERPGNVGQATSQRLGYLKGFHPGGAITGGGGSSGGGGASGNFGVKDSDDVLGHLQTMKQKGMITGDQCVSLAMASVGVPYAGGAAGGHTGDWRRGESAESGNLVKGTPVSTFAGLHGEQNQDIYAGGTGGRMKAGLDHAAVFETYVKNKDGKITGMVVDEQYVGSKGVHAHQYDFGGGYGEHDARNYSAIDVAGGGHLGGANNPLTQRDAAREASTRTASRSGPHPHIGDMSQYHTNQAIKVNVNNPAGADVIAQTSMLGSAQGNYG
jgi:hypothetical protein